MKLRTTNSVKKTCSSLLMKKKKKKIIMKINVTIKKKGKIIRRFQNQMLLVEDLG